MHLTIPEFDHEISVTYRLALIYSQPLPYLSNPIKDATPTPAISDATPLICRSIHYPRTIDDLSSRATGR